MEYGFKEIEPFLTNDEINEYLSMVDADGWHRHKSTQSGRVSPLQFKAVKFRNIVTNFFKPDDVENAMIMKMDPNEEMWWHTDGVGKRQTTIIHPIHPSTDYAPFETRDEGKYYQSSKPIIANTLAEHAVFNNDNVRLNLQIPFNIEFEDAIQEDSIVMKTLKQIYSGA